MCISKEPEVRKQEILETTMRLSSIYYTFTTFGCLFMLVNVNLCKVSSKKKMPIKPVNTGYIDIYQFMKR